MSLELKMSTVIQRKEDELLISPLADEIVMMNVKSGDYIGLNKVASDIWSKIEQPSSIQNICDDLLSKYEVDEVSCKEQTLAVIQKFVENKIVEVKTN